MLFGSFLGGSSPTVHTLNQPKLWFFQGFHHRNWCSPVFVHEQFDQVTRFTGMSQPISPWRGNLQQGITKIAANFRCSIYDQCTVVVFLGLFVCLFV